MNYNDNSESRVAVEESASLREALIESSNERHFKTDHLLGNLKKRTVSSGFITFISQGIQFFLTLASTMVLARLLAPRDFGLLAMVYTVTNFLMVFKDAGLSMATV